MKTSKFLFSTLVAVAAMTSSVYAETYTVIGKVKEGNNSTLATDGGTIDSVSNTSVTLTSDDTVIFNGASGYLPGWNKGTFVANIILTDNGTTKALTISNGSSTYGTTQTFSGSISGDGGFALGTHVAAKATTYIFSGNATKFNGLIDASSQLEGTVGGTGGGIQFGDGSVYSNAASVLDGTISNISGAGVITAGNKLIYNYAASDSYTTLSVNNSSITAANLEFKGGASYSLASDTTVSNSLTIAAGTSLSIAAGKTLTLAGTVSLGSAIQNSGTVTLSEGLKIDLTGYVTEAGEYTIVSGGAISAAEGISFSGYMRGASYSSTSAEGALKVNVADGTAGTITWAGTAEANTWNTNTENWTIANGEETSPTSFFYKDNVVFDSTATNKTVALANGADLTVGTATVSSTAVDPADTLDDYTWSIASGIATVSGTTLTVLNGATLNVGNSDQRTINLNFDNIEIQGTLKFQNGTSSWKKLTLNGGTLDVFDTRKNSDLLGLSIEETIVSADSTITSSWSDEGVNLGVLSGSGNLEIQNPSSSVGAFFVSDLNEYNGKLTLGGGTGTKKLSLTILDSSKLGDANVVVGSNTVLAFGGDTDATVSLSNVDAAAGTIQKSGACTVTFSDIGTINELAVSDGAANISGTASVTTLNISGGTVNLETTSWSSPTAINLTANGATLNFKKSGENGTTYTVGEIKTTSVDNFNRNVTVDEGVTVKATSLNNGWGMKSLTVNGVLDLAGVLKFATGNQASHSASTTETNVITGTGTIKANELSIGNVGHYQFQGGIRLEIGSGGITAIGGSGNGRNWGHATLAVAKTWTNTVSHGFTLTDATNGTTIEVANDQTATLSGVFSGSGMLIKDGTGALTLSGANTYEGGTVISAGTLVAASATALGKGDVSVGEGATLMLKTGVTVSDGAVSLAEGAKFALDLNGFSLSVSDEDSIALNILSATALTFNGTGAGLLSSEVIDGYFDAGNSNLGDYTTYLREWSYANNTLTLTLAIPEPSMFGLLAGLGALALVGTRRRRK